MKNTRRNVTKRRSLLAIALVAVIGFAMAACEEASDETTAGRLTITGLSSYSGWTITADVDNGKGEGQGRLQIGKKYGNGDSLKVPLTVSGASVTFEIWQDFQRKYNDSVGLLSYTGNDKNVMVGFSLQKGNEYVDGSPATANFSNGKATVQFVPY